MSTQEERDAETKRKERDTEIRRRAEKARRRDAMERLFDAFHRMCTKDGFDLDREQEADGDALERLSVLAGVWEFPIRVKCARPLPGTP